MNLLDCPQVILRPFKSVHFREIRLAELLEILPALLFPLGIGHFRQFTDVAPCERFGCLPLRRRLAVRRIPSLALLSWRIVPIDKPCGIAVKVEAAGIIS